MADEDIQGAERRKFESYLRTGRLPTGSRAPERKFNPYHDPRNGQFTFAPGGPKSIADPIFSDTRGLWKKPASTHGSDLSRPPAKQPEPVKLARNPQSYLQPAQYQPNSRARRGGNGGPPLNDPLVIEQVFPTLRNSPAGSVIGIADNIFDLSGPARAATESLHDARVKQLIRQIQAIDSGYHYQSLGPVRTMDGRLNEIKTLRLARALAFYRVRGEMRPLQVEVTRIMQERADVAYADAVAQYNAGRLTPRLSREEAIGNYIDGAVRTDLRRVFNANHVDISRGQPVRVVGREYDSSGSDLTYRIPDARVGNIAFDVTLTRKTLGTRQVRGFFNADFQPTSVIIVRPSQLGQGNTYAIKRPR